MLDDVLSAVDVNVGEEIFHSCIRGLLSNKTVILVTHHTYYTQFSDWCIIMKNGTIDRQGWYHIYLQYYFISKENTSEYNMDQLGLKRMIC